MLIVDVCIFEKKNIYIVNSWESVACILLSKLSESEVLTAQQGQIYLEHPPSPG